MFSDAKYFVPGTLKSTYEKIKCADGKFLYAHWKGTVIITRDPSLPPSRENSIICKDSLLVEGITKSLISTPQLDDEYSFLMENGKCIISSPEDQEGKREIIFKLNKAKRTDNLYHLPFYAMSEVQGNDPSQVTHTAGSASVEKITMDLAHLIYNHAQPLVLTKLFPHLEGQELSFCEACALAALKNKPYSTKPSTKYNKENLRTYIPKKELAQELEANLGVNTDLRRNRKQDTNKPFTDIAADGFTSPAKSVRDMKYVYVLVDTVTKMCYSFLTENKSDFKKEYIEWAKHIYNKTGKFPAYIRVDKGGELTSGDMMEFFSECGTKPSVTNTKQSNQNAFAERLIGVLWSKTKVLLTQCGLPLTYWCYAFAHVSVVYNHTPHRALNFKRPIDVAGVIPVDSLLRPFGCESYYYKPIGNKGELTGHRAIFLGFDNVKKGYNFLDLSTKKVVSSRTAIFRWKNFPFLIANKGVPLPHDFLAWPKPSVIRRQEERGGVSDLPPNTITITRDSLNDNQTTEWDTFRDPPSTIFNKAIETTLNNDKIDNKKNNIINKIGNWFKLTVPKPKDNNHKSNTNINAPLSEIKKHGNTPLDLPTPFYLPSISKPNEDTNNKNNKEKYTNSDEKYEVERILEHKKIGRGYRYLVKWDGYKSPTWVPGRNMIECDEALNKYFSTIDVKKSLTDDFENTTALDNDTTTKQRVLSRFQPPPLRPLTRHYKNKLGKINESNEESNKNDEEDTKHTDNQNDNNEDNDEGETTTYQIPLTKDIVPDTIATGGIPPVPEVNFTGTKIDPPPDYSGHHMFTTETLDLNKILSYAFSTQHGADLFEAILAEEKTSFETAPPSQTTMLKGNKVKEFVEAEERELTGILKHGTWEVVIRPKNRTPITCRWCYDIKRNNKNEIILHKARLVVHGYKQVEGVDFNKTFSSTAQMRTFRTIVMLAEAFDLDLTQYDISNAFLNGELEEEIYMEYPPGYEGEPGTCLKLLKGLYGLKQAARIWNKVLTQVLRKAGLEICKTEPGVLYHPTKMCFVCLHVDDIIVATDDKKLKATIVQLLKENFLVKELGKLTQFVGIEVIRTKGSITLRQTAYAERVWDRLKSFVNRYKSKSQSKTPNPSEKLSKLDVPINPDDSTLEYPFPSVVGSLMYLVTATRPDLMQPVVQLARFMAGWGQTHINAANKALKFMNNTKSNGIIFTKPPNFDGKLRIMCFSDSDWAGCPDTRRSTIGYTIVVCGGPISWKSSLHKTLAHSSCEAEYIALSEIGREIIWLCNFFDEIGVKYHRPQIFCDSASAIKWSEDPIQHQRTKHVEIDYYYIRDIIAKEKVDLFKIDTESNLADIFTKNVDTKTFNRLRPYLMGWKRVELTSI